MERILRRPDCKYRDTQQRQLRQLYVSLILFKLWIEHSERLFLFHSFVYQMHKVRTYSTYFVIKRIEYVQLLQYEHFCLC